MPKNGQRQRALRQRPVSCQFCRSRKLRCSRDAPCSNCVSRGIECNLERLATHSPEISPASNAELIDRIRRLERLLEDKSTQQNESTTQQLETPGSLDRSPPTSSLSPQTDQLASEVAWLESIYNDQVTLGSGQSPSSKLIFKVCPIERVMEAQPYISQGALPLSPGSEPSRCIWLPQHAEAKVLLEKFVRDVSHIHHVVHIPSLPTLLDSVYACLDLRNNQPPPGHIILLLSIFASSTESWVPEDCAHGVFSTAAEANCQSSFWVKAAEDVLNIAQRQSVISLEGVQGILIVSFVLLNIGGVFRRCRSLYNTALQLARDIGLHRVDHPSHTSSSNTIQKEIGRRVWWYLAASDWMIAARFSGSALGTYQCHVRHMVVKKPMNINDEDLRDDTNCIDRPLSWPTDMSYLLHRLQLAEISRNLVDRAPLMLMSADSYGYDIIIDIDTELQTLINNLPAFFSMPKSELMKTYKLNAAQAKNIVQQGYMIRSNIYSQRGKLHLPYFSRGFIDLTYAPSREICIQSARLIVQNETEMDGSELGTSTRYRFLGLMLSVIMASIVLLMDLCHSKSSPQRDVKRSELADAFRLLEDARNESETVGKLLDSMMQILRKNKIPAPKQQSPQTKVNSEQSFVVANTAAEHSGPADVPVVDSSSIIDSMDVLQSNQDFGANQPGDGVLYSNELSSYFDELTQGLDHGVDIGTFDWENIFSGLDSSFI